MRPPSTWSSHPEANPAAREYSRLARPAPIADGASSAAPLAVLFRQATREERTMPPLKLSVQDCLPRSAGEAVLVGRAWLPSEQGPAVIGVRGDEAVDLTRSYPTVSHLLNVAKPADVRAAIGKAPALARLDVLVGNSVEGARNAATPWLLAPCDLQAVKASGVTFIASLLERVIEERARGTRRSPTARGG